MKLLPSPAAPVPDMFGSEAYWSNCFEAELMRSAGIWLLGKGEPVWGSRMVARPAKLPDFRAVVGRAEITVVEARRRSPSNEPKKNNLSFTTGPPAEPPNSLRLNGGFGRPVAKKF